MRTRRAVNIGDRFGRLLILGESHRKNGFTFLNVVCDCGKTFVKRKDALYTGNTRSCGCLLKETTRQRFLTHGMSGETPEYRTWARMKRRCYTPSTTRFDLYGGRGIKVCERWHKFENFFADMGTRLSPKHTLDRKDSNAHYSCGYCAQCIENNWPMNCRWATWDVQANNTSRNHYLTWNNKTQTFRQWEREMGLGRNTLYHRISHNWTTEQALTTPTKVKHSSVLRNKII